MSTTLTAHTVVVVAQELNPSVVNPLWLHKHGIVDEVEFRSDSCFYTRQIARVETPEFEMLVLPERLQFAPNLQSASTELVQRVIGKFTLTLPHTPYSAVGFNFIWKLDPPVDETLENYTRRLFFRRDTTYAPVLDSDESLFGGFFSKPAKGGILQIEARPHRENQRKGFVGITINYHFDVVGDQVLEQVSAALARWQDLMDDSSRLAHSFVE